MSTSMDMSYAAVILSIWKSSEIPVCLSSSDTKRGSHFSTSANKNLASYQQSQTMVCLYVLCQYSSPPGLDFGVSYLRMKHAK